MNNIICIAGPTASGKTALAVELAKMFNGEVVSCDSMQIYRRMDIGTAKPFPDERQGIPHHMIDVCEPDEDFSVSKYCEMATPIVDDILARGKTAIIAGGTGLYMDSLIKGNDFAPFPATGHRERLEEKLDQVGLDAMIAELASIDPEAVHMDRAVDFVPTVTRPYLSYGSIFRASPTGVWGEPSYASAEKGEKILERTTELMVEELNKAFAYMEAKEKFGYSDF